MPKLTIEIDMEDTQEAWDALYRRIEKFADSDEKPQSATQSASPLTYDLLLDPERTLGKIGDYFGVQTRSE